MKTTVKISFDAGKIPEGADAILGYATVFQQPGRLFYRAEDLADAKDFNGSREWFGDYFKESETQRELWPHPLILVTPKVMNLLRGKTKKDQKYQGCDFIPIWIEGEK